MQHHIAYIQKKTFLPFMRIQHTLQEHCSTYFMRLITFSKYCLVELHYIIIIIKIEILQIIEQKIGKH